jgi:hypothetical protein
VVVGGLDVDRDPVGPRLRERVDELLGLGQHEVRVEEELRAVAPERGEGLGAEGEVGHEVPVHHVEVQPLEPEAATASAPFPRAAWSLARSEGARIGAFIGGQGSPDVEDGVGHLVGEELGQEGERVVLRLELVVAGAEGHEAEAVVGEGLTLDLDLAPVKEQPARAVVLQAAGRLKPERELAGQPVVVLPVGGVVAPVLDQGDLERRVGVGRLSTSCTRPSLMKASRSIVLTSSRDCASVVLFFVGSMKSVEKVGAGPAPIL